MAETPNTLVLLLRLGLSLAVVLALVGAVTWVLKRRGMLRPVGQAAPSGRLELVDRKSLGKRASIVVARIGDVSVLLGVTDQQVNVLAQRASADGTWSGSASTAATTTGSTATPAAPPADVDAHGRPDGPADDGGAAAEPRRFARRCSTAAGITAHEMTTGSRRTGTRVHAQGAGTTPPRMSFVEALRELTVRKS